MDLENTEMSVKQKSKPNPLDYKLNYTNPNQEIRNGAIRA